MFKHRTGRVRLGRRKAIGCAVAEALEARLLLSSTAYHLTFDDEFNTLNLSNGPTSNGWLTCDYYTNPYLGGEQEYYALQNGPSFHDAYNPFSVANGILSITAQPNKNTSGNPIVTTTANPKYPTDSQPYLSGELTTAAGYPSSTYPQSLGFAQKYGYFEIRAELPNTQGMWPAFWLMPSDGSSTAEYDVFEVPINKSSSNETPEDIYQTIHWGGYTGGDPHVNDQGYDYNNSINTSTGFHTYGFAWTPTTCTWYVDGVATQTQINRSDKPMYMLLNLAIGGSWPGDVNGTTTWPETMSVDYVHVYSSDSNLPAITPQAGYTASMPAGVGTVNPTGTTYAGILGGSFEPTFTTNGLTLNVTGTPWTFTGTSGIIADGTGSYNEPNAPDGLHAALLGNTASFSQIFAAPSSATDSYTISFQAANRTSSTNNFSVFIDGTQIGSTFNPTANDAYAVYQTASFTLTPGNHTVAFTGLDTGGGNRTVFIDDILLNAVTANGQSLGTPSGLTATAGSVEGTAMLNWTDATGNVTGYQIERRTGVAGGYTVVASVGAAASSYTDTGLTTEVNTTGPISYRVAALNSTYGVSSAYTANATVTPLASPLATPAALLASAVAGNHVLLSWLNESYYSTAIQVYRMTGSSGNYTQVGGNLTNANTWIDTTTAAGTSYSYQIRVQGVIISGSSGNYTTSTAYSGNTSAVSVETTTAAPTGLTGAPATSSSINLSWTAPSGTLMGYNLFRGNSSGAESSTPVNGATLITGTTYTDTSLSLGSTYYYYVETVDSGGASVPSAEVSVSIAPTIGALTASPGSVVAGTAVTLTAASVAEVSGGNISNVVFYRESNGVAGLQTGGDTLLGNGTKSGSNWTIPFATTGMVPGTCIVYAVATDATGYSSPVATGYLNINPSHASGNQTAYGLDWHDDLWRFSTAGATTTYTQIICSGGNGSSGGDVSSGSLFGLTEDSSGNLYLVDGTHNQIDKITVSGNTATVSALSTTGVYYNGPDIECDGTYLYIAGLYYGSNVYRETLAGTGLTELAAATSPQGMTLLGGNLYYTANNGTNDFVYEVANAASAAASTSSGTIYSIPLNTPKATLKGMANDGANIYVLSNNGSSQQILEGPGLALFTNFNAISGETLSYGFYDNYTGMLFAGDRAGSASGSNSGHVLGYDATGTLQKNYGQPASGGEAWIGFAVPPMLVSSTTVATSATPSAYGQAVTFTATVTPASGSGETGSVQFILDGSSVNTATLSGNTATYATAVLSAGSHTICALYSGDGKFATSTSSAIVQYVIPAWLSTASAATWNAGNQTLTVTGNATLIADPAASGVSPIINAGNGSKVTLATAMAHIGGLTLAAGATLDIAADTLLINYGSGSSPLAMVQSAVGNGTIISSTANAGKAGQFTVGFADSTELAAIPGGNVELIYTLAGDAYLAGTVNFNDYSVLQNNYNQTGRDWAQGDFNHDGTANFNDYSMLQNNYNQSAGTVFSAVRIGGNAESYSPMAALPNLNVYDIDAALYGWNQDSAD